MRLAQERLELVLRARVGSLINPLDSIVHSLSTGLYIRNSVHRFSTISQAFFSEEDRTIIFKVLAERTDSMLE